MPRNYHFCFSGSTCALGIPVTDIKQRGNFDYNSLLQGSLKVPERMLMREDIFNIAADAVRFRRVGSEVPDVVRAAKAVLVKGVKPSAAAEQFAVQQSRVSEAIAKIRAKWDEICDKQGWVTHTLSLPADIMDLVRQIEANAIKPLLVAKPKRKRVKTT